MPPMAAFKKANMKTLLMLVLVITAAAAAYILVFMDDSVTHDFVAGEVCEDLAAYSSTRPSSLEVNRLEVYGDSLTRRDAVVWRTWETNMTPAQEAVLTSDYDQGRPYREIVAALDYSVDGGLRSVRDLMVCTFVFDNRTLALRSILQGNTTLYRGDDTALNVMMASRLDSMWNVDDISPLDRLRAAMSYIGISQ